MTRILVASTHRLFRESLVLALGREAGLDIVGQAAVRSAGQTARALKPDILILDISGSDPNEAEAVKNTIAQNPDIKIIALAEAAVPHRIWPIINMGVSGYLLKSCPLKEVVNAVQAVAAGGIHLGPEVSVILIKTISKKQQDNSIFSLLSGREREVLQLIAEGYKHKEIARKLYISPKTVQIHQSNLKKKLKLTTTAELTKYAVSKGITPLEFIIPPPSK